MLGRAANLMGHSGEQGPRPRSFGRLTYVLTAPLNDALPTADRPLTH